ncbi:MULTISPECIES: hypothetical protein [unclassified Flavobacterium]|jgi:hypothetical protein|uniref:hypothetical protein n=1 Tax=unclassified Flavobacterium TaxID=196869 RepID=UPI00070FF9FB|nr:MULTISPECIES: hypothetical protein [unclassified Flavobacterium]KRD61457.1 hypothetical protein ASE40_07955 [Flavobacterium sp. Root935]TDX12677.1 hypothetical protein EDB96_1753 [Flavobacterium sp. S87F.05.LMB.W.Kidney.N]BDU27138.1 hypothetical protein FLGSB24_38820 [Flavobacterium sp. GSB-24]
MGDFLASAGCLAALASVLAFFIGLFRLIFISDDKNTSLKIILYSVIGFVIGFGTCAANFSLGGMH